jgi:hypothetical protein
VGKLSFKSQVFPETEPTSFLLIVKEAKFHMIIPNMTCRPSLASMLLVVKRYRSRRSS